MNTIDTKTARRELYHLRCAVTSLNDNIKAMERGDENLCRPGGVAYSIANVREYVDKVEEALGPAAEE